MTDSKDLVEQFLNLPDDRREVLAAHIFSLFPPRFHSRGARMRTSADFPSVVRTPTVCGGSARLIRTRIPVWLLQHMRRLGFSDAKILDCYPTLTAGDLTQVWGYAAAHQAEIDGEIDENEQY